MNPQSIQSSLPAPDHASAVPSFYVPEDLDEPTFVEPWRRRLEQPVSPARSTEQGA